MIIFQSDASGDVMMFKDVAQRMMKIMGKDVSERGVITIGQMPECIASLKAAIAEDRAKARVQANPHDEEAEETGVAARVSLAQRAIPLVELLERSLEREKPVLWGLY